MAFEKFTQIGRGFQPIVSIWQRGQMGFNAGAVERFNLKENPFVVFFYDREAQKVGFRFTKNESEDGARSINLRGKGGTIGAKPFLDYYGIEYGEKRRFFMRFDEESQMAVIDLHDEIKPGPSKQ